MNSNSSLSNPNLWGMLLHFSVFASYIVPVAGVLAPIVIWQVKKNEMPIIDAHGKVVVNAMISFYLYGIVGFLLSFVMIGFAVLFALAIAAIVFPIIGGIKANNGEVWPYPLTIQFIK